MCALYNIEMKIMKQKIKKLVKYNQKNYSPLVKLIETFSFHHLPETFGKYAVFTIVTHLFLLFSIQY